MVNIYHKPGNGRLHFQYMSSPLRYGAWITLGGHYLQGSWWQVDFGSWTKVTIIATQGRQDAAQWVTKYRVSYSYDRLFFSYYKEGDYTKVFFSRLRTSFSYLSYDFTFNLHGQFVSVTYPRRTLFQLDHVTRNLQSKERKTPRNQYCLGS